MNEAHRLHPHLGAVLTRLGLDLAAPPSVESWGLLLGALSDTLSDQELQRALVERTASASARQMQELEVERDRMRQLFERAPIGIVRLELDGQITMMNPVMGKMVGCKEGELATAADLFNLVHPDDRPKTAASYRSLQGKHASLGYLPQPRLLHKNGETVYANVVVSVALDDQKKPMFTIVVVEEISERIRLEVDLRQSQKLESVGRLASGIAHELNSPIQFISDNTSFLRSAYEDLLALCDSYQGIFEQSQDRLPAEQQAALLQAREIADLEYVRAHGAKAFAATVDGMRRITTIVKSMRALAHPDQGKRSAADINTALRNTLIVAANELDHVADVQASFDDLDFVECCLAELNQVFFILLGNAADAVGDVVRRTRKKGRIIVRTQRDVDSAVISVTDDGTGIPQDIRQKIFDPFFTTKEVGRGTGQGLAVARSVVERYGGTLTFQTEVGQGTTFFVRLPMLSATP